jgi:rRNA maturation endonuclease Nob1
MIWGAYCTGCKSVWKLREGVSKKTAWQLVLVACPLCGGQIKQGEECPLCGQQLAEKLREGKP